MIWVANNVACETLAVEVQSNAKCVPEPITLIRATVPDLMPASRTAPLPMSRRQVGFVWQMPESGALRDELDAILADRTRPLAYYQFVGPCFGGADPGNSLRAVKDALTPAVVVEKR